MADELDKKLKQIADMFGVSDTSGLKNIVNNMVSPESSSNKADSSPGSNTPLEEKVDYRPPPVSRTAVLKRA